MKFKRNLDLTSYNSYGLRSVARWAYFPESTKDLEAFVSRFAGTRIEILGTGNNVILSREYYGDVRFLMLRENAQGSLVTGTTLVALCGTSLQALSEAALQHGLSGLEIFYDIPGTLGGAIAMNAGAYGQDISQRIESVLVLDMGSLTFRELRTGEIGWGYRECSIGAGSGSIVWAARLRLTPDEGPAIWERMSSTRSRRWSHQPRELPSAGSVFRRPPTGLTVGEMVERAGLKGARRGGARISPRHGGFIVNEGGARSADILSLIELMRKTVLREFHVELSLEQRVIE